MRNDDSGPNRRMMVIRFVGDNAYIYLMGKKRVVRMVKKPEERRMLRRLYCSLIIEEAVDDEPEIPADVIRLNSEWDI